MKSENLSSLYKVLVQSPTSRAYLACGAFVLALAFSAAVLANRFFPGLGDHTSNFVLLAVPFVVVPVLAIAGLALRRPELAIKQFSEFASRLDGDTADEISVHTSHPDVQRLGEELNKASQRFYARRQELERSCQDLEQIAGLADESPSLIITIDHFGELRYLNARAHQVISSLGLRQTDLSLLLPKPTLQLVETCITNQEALSNIEVSYNDYTFVWTVKPVRGKAMLQAHATVASNRQQPKSVTQDNSRLAESIPNRPPQLFAISKHPDYKHKSATILVIDDDPIVHDLMSRYFIRDGYDVHCADGGDVGLEMAVKLKPDLITLDIMMPGKNGWIVLSTLKDDPQLAGIPVIIVSGVGNQQFVHAMGADDYVSKPVDWNELGRKVARHAIKRGTTRVAT
jgi:CheY-like chemotaxis protein